MNIAATIPLLALACYGILLIIVARGRLRDLVGLFFALYLLCMIIWSFASFMMHIDVGVMNMLFWNRLLVVGATGAPISFFGFVAAFLRRKETALLAVGVALYLIIQIANVLGYVVVDAFVADGLIYNRYGPGLAIVGASWAFFLGYSAYSIVRGYETTKDVLYRARIRYLLLVVAAIFAGSLTNTTNLQVYPVDIAFNTVSALLITYAIVRHQLLDISVVVRKGMLYSIPTVTIGAGYFLLISLTTNVFQQITSAQMIVLSFVAALVAALVAEPLRVRGQLWVDRLFFREKYDSSLMLQRLSHTAASVLDFDRLTRMILDEVAETMHVGKLALFIRQDGGGEFRLAAQRGLELERGFAIRADHPVVQWLTGHDHALMRNDLDLMPRFRSLWAQERRDLERIGAELLLPLHAREEMVGIFAVGAKLSEEPYSPDDQLTLHTLASQTAMAIENARLYSAAQQELAERKRAEEERNQMQAQLLQAQKMEAVGRLAGGVAHDFNNLLTAIISYSDFLLNRLDTTDRRRGDVEEIKRAGERAAALTRQLLAFSRRQMLQPQVLHLNDVVLDIGKMLRRLIGEDIKLTVALDPALETVRVDPSQLEQVILNLAINARDAMPDGGALTIRTENVTVDESQARLVPEARPGRFVCLSVEDTGAGISVEIREHLFEPFFTTKEQGKGTGLGLAVVHGVISQHGGWVVVDSVPGQGARFHVYLPVVAAASSNGDAIELALDPLCGHGERVLLVEDESSVRDAISRALEENGYTILAAANAAEALELYEREQGRFDLLLSDVVLPGQSGVQLAEELLARKPGLRVLLTSGYADREPLRNAIRQKDFRFLQKPYDVAGLLHAVHETIVAGRHVGAVIS